jgi:hypothetical protein
MINDFIRGGKSFKLMVLAKRRRAMQACNPIKE